MDSCVRKKSSKIKPMRDFDVYYDTTISYACNKDYMRDKGKAVSASTTYKVQPLYDSMFSDTKPRLNIIPKTIKNEEEFKTSYAARTSNTTCLPKSMVLGSRRPFFFKQPIILKSQSAQNESSQKTEDSVRPKEKPQEGPCNKQTQTDFRDSESQTIPWAHDIIALQGLQLLQLGWLKVDQQNPPGKAEIDVIERFWQRKAWENAIPQTQLINTAERLTLTEAMAINETDACNAYLEAINIRRLKLSAKNISIDLRDNMYELNCRLYRFAELFKSNRADTVAYLRHKLQRNLRQLNKKYRSKNIDKIQEKPYHISYDSLTRQPGLKSMLNQFLNPLDGMELLERKALSSPKVSKPTRIHSPKMKNQYCRRNVTYLEKGYPLKSDKGCETVKITLLTPLKKESVDTPSIEDNAQWIDEEQYYCSILNRIIQGRCVQILSSSNENNK